MHSWYKHIPLECQDFYASLHKGQQGRYGFANEIDDYEGQHWHFYLRDNCDSTEYKICGPIRLGPFLQGVHDNTYENYYMLCSFHIIFRKNKNTFLNWIELNYPKYYT